MKQKRFLLIAALSVLMAGAATAQDKLKSYSYVEAQGGVQLTSTNAPMDKLLTPTASLSFGHYFTPVIGARLHVNGWQSKSGFEPLDQYYKWKYVTPSVDLMINLCNLFSKSTNHALNVILLGGVGVNYAWDNDELNGLSLDPKLAPLAWDKDRLNHNLRAGLRLETNVRKPFGVSLEVNANSVDDRFNSKSNDADDWQFTAQLGLSWRFGHKYRKSEPAPVVREVVEEPVKEVVPAPAVVEKKPEPKAVVKRETVKLHKEVFYGIRVSENETPSAICNYVIPSDHYTIECTARKDDGPDGFIIVFNYVNPQNYCQLNFGTCGNTLHALEQISGDVKTQTASRPGSVETGKWYGVKLTVAGDSVKAWLDNEVVFAEVLKQSDSSKE